MDTNRDDFVIAVRSAFLKKGYKQRFSLVALIIFSISILILGNLNFKPISYLRIFIKEIVYRSSFIVSVPENYLTKSYNAIGKHFKMYAEYEILKADLKNLKSDTITEDFLLTENQRLKNIIGDNQITSNETISKIILDKQSPFLRSLVVNKGSKDDIKLGMAILDENFLVGKIIEVNYLTSRVLLLSDLNSKVPVSIEPGGYQAILSGTGKDYAIIQYIKKDYIIENGSIVYTSGSGGLFKAGIPIGTIKKTNENQKKIIEFFSDFSQLRYVNIKSFEQQEN